MSLEALNLIVGRWQPAASGEYAASRNPADDTGIGRHAASGAADAEMAIASARAAFERPAWAQAPRLCTTSPRPSTSTRAPAWSAPAERQTLPRKDIHEAQ
jgi:hypothetical protein